MISTLPSTSPTQEMTNLQIDTETPNTSNTTQIDFIYSKKDGFHHIYNSKLQRPMPELLCGVVTENDFESFCDNIDLVLERYPESKTVLANRLEYMFWYMPFMTVLGLALVFCLIAVPHDKYEYYSPVFSVIFLLIMAPFFALFFAAFATACRHDCCEKRAFRNQIHMECLELTNRTDNATFLLVMHVIEDEYSEYINKEFSHISVLVSGNDQLKHNVTDDDDATVCTLENVSQ